MGYVVLRGLTVEVFNRMIFFQGGAESYQQPYLQSHNLLVILYGPDRLMQCGLFN